MKRALCIPVFALLACAAALASTPTNASTFFVAKTFATGHSPDCIAVGDFNGDGKLDIVTGDSADAAVAVLLGVGNGTFKPARNYLVDGAPLAVQVADFNGDGKLDLAVATGLDIFILLGNGDGSFRIGGIYAAGTFAGFLALGDFNGDGKLDIAFNSDYSLVAGVILGNGDGTFQGFQPLSSFVSGPVAVGDFDGDGKLDLMVANDGFNGIVANLQLFPGNGDGTFGSPKQSSDLQVWPTSIAVGDFNKDGKLDVAVGNKTTGSIAVLLGDGGNHIGGFHFTTTGGGASSLTTADVDGDGNLDLIVGNTGDNDVSILRGNGKGLFVATANYVAGSGQPLSVAVGDFNGDGKPDIAVANQGTNNVSVLLASGGGRFTDAQDFRVGQIAQYEAAGDFNHDGKQDLVVSSYETGLTISYGNGNGTFQKPVQITSKINSPVVAVDLNGDGFLDLVAIPLNTSYVAVLMNNGDGSWGFNVFFAGEKATSLAVGDFNNDGKMDVAVTIQSFVSILLGNGDGTFQSPLPFSAGTQPSGLTVGDFNGDGQLDIATGDSGASDVAVILGKGDGTFRSAQIVPLPPAGSALTIASGFFRGTGRGKLDLAALVSGGTSTVYILVNNGNGTFNAPGAGYSAGSVVNGTTSMAVTDFNLDGNADIALAAGGSNATVLFGNGQGSFAVTTFGFGGGTFVNEAVAADFNGDGKPDLAIANGDGITMLLNQTK